MIKATRRCGKQNILKMKKMVKTWAQDQIKHTDRVRFAYCEVCCLCVSDLASVIVG